jgi:hypothetical protein
MNTELNRANEANLAEGSEGRRTRGPASLANTATFELTDLGSARSETQGSAGGATDAPVPTHE